MIKKLATGNRRKLWKPDLVSACFIRLSSRRLTTAWLHFVWLRMLRSCLLVYTCLWHGYCTYDFFL
jgi:hypothetical protein